MIMKLGSLPQHMHNSFCDVVLQRPPKVFSHVHQEYLLPTIVDSL